MGVARLVFQIEYSPEAQEHVRELIAKNRRLVLDAVDVHLAHLPRMETRKRKKMRANPIAPWRLRVGNLRVYYDVDETSRRVLIRAVGIKVGSRVRIGKEILEL